MRDERSLNLADILDDIHWSVPDYGSVRASEEFKDHQRKNLAEAGFSEATQIGGLSVES